MRLAEVGKSRNGLLAHVEACNSSPFSQLRLVILNANQGCNSRCIYCYQGPCLASSPMSLDVVRDTLALVDSTAGNQVSLLLHGGEPLLNGMAWFRELSDQLTRVKNVRRLLLQTNGVLLDDEKADWVRRSDVKVGISCDGPPGLNEVTRYFSPPMEAFRRLRSRGVQFAVLSVLSQHNVGHVPALLDFLESEGVSTMRLNRVYAPVGSPLSVTPEQFSRALSDAWSWAYEKHRRLVVRNVADSERTMLSIRRASGTCESRPCGAARTVLAVDADGEMFPCNRLVGSSGCSLGPISAPDVARFRAFRLELDGWAKSRRDTGCFAMEVGRGLADRTGASRTRPIPPVPTTRMRYAHLEPDIYSDSPGYDDWCDYGDAYSW